MGQPMIGRGMTRRGQMAAFTSAGAGLLAIACGGADAPAAAPTAKPPEAPQPTKAPAVAVPTVPAAKSKMTVWITTSFTPDADKVQNDYVMEWAKSKNVDVTIVQDTGTVLATQLNAALESKALPDVLWGGNGEWAPRLNLLDLTLDVSDLLAKMNAQGGGLLPPALRAVQKDGKAFWVPTYSATEVFYVRKDLLDAKGLKVPETWEDVYTVAKALTDKGKVWGYGQQLGTPSYDAEISLLTMLASYGASPYAADSKTLNLNKPGTRKVLEMINQAWLDGSIPPDAVTWDDSGNNKAYLTRSAAMIYNTGSVVNAMRKDDQELLKNTVVTRIPKGSEGSVLVGYIYGLIALKTSKVPDLAKDLISFMVAVERQQKIVEAAGTNYMPLYKDLAKMPMWQDPINQILMSELADNNAVGYPGPTTMWSLEAWKTHTVTEMVNKVIVEKKTVDVAITETEAKLVKIYDQFNKK